MRRTDSFSSSKIVIFTHGRFCFCNFTEFIIILDKYFSWRKIPNDFLPNSTVVVGQSVLETSQKRNDSPSFQKIGKVFCPHYKNILRSTNSSSGKHIFTRKYFQTVHMNSALVGFQEKYFCKNPIKILTRPAASKINLKTSRTAILHTTWIMAFHIRPQ